MSLHAIIGHPHKRWGIKGERWRFISDQEAARYADEAELSRLRAHPCLYFVTPPIDLIFTSASEAAASFFKVNVDDIEAKRLFDQEGLWPGS